MTTTLETRMASLTVDQLRDVLRGLAANPSDAAASVTTAGLARLARLVSEEAYCSFCDELYGAWG